MILRPGMYTGELKMSEKEKEDVLKPHEITLKFTDKEFEELQDILESVKVELIAANDCDYPSKDTEKLIQRLEIMRRRIFRI